MPLAATFAQLATAAGYRRDDPLVVAVARSGGRPAFLARGCVPSDPAACSPDGTRFNPAHPAPLSIGDGGLWSTAADLLQWCAGMDEDRLGIAAMMQTPGRLDDGTMLDYAWGMGRRLYGGEVVYRHGGSYADVRTMMVRVPQRRLDVVIIALADHSDRCAALATATTEALLTSLPVQRVG